MEPFTVTQINDHTYQIAEVYHLPAALPMYLIVGTERAALIDTGMGLPGLRKTVEEITNLPVSVYNTHAHMDHAAGNPQFDRCYMHPDEEAQARGDFPVQQRLEFIELKCMYDPERESILEYARQGLSEYDSNYEIFYITDGEHIDLGGGIILEAIHVPGHTQGSMVYVNRADGFAFCGDSLNPRSSIAMWPGAPTIAVYCTALQHLFDLTKGDVTRYYVGHRLYYFEQQDVKDVLQCAQEILNGVPGEPVALVMNRTAPARGWIHWCNGKRITYQKECIR